jgi:subfamily B ATP-binding cassette protein HlyB/CyaB
LKQAAQRDPRLGAQGKTVPDPAGVLREFIRRRFPASRGKPFDPRAPLGDSDFLWLLGSLSELHHLPFDAALALERHPAPHDIAALLHALEELGLDTEWAAADAPGAVLPPFVAFAGPSRPGVAADGADQDNADPALVTAVLVVGSDRVQSDTARLLYFQPHDKMPRQVSMDEFLARFEASVLRVRPAVRTLDDPDAARETTHRFGFRWFWPELRRHRAIFRDVLLASFAIQMLGLGLPLFTQIVIDKVIAHRTLSTLAVVGVGMALFTGFSALLSWLRQYLLIHTGNRIDAVLAARVFAHLLHLPMPYFLHRSTGVLVARLQGVETVREFVTGAAIGLLLDLPFMLVFLTVMFIYSWQLALLVVVMLGIVALLSLVFAPTLRERLNRQFLLGARNQAFVTEHLAGMETVKSLRMEPRLTRRHGDLLAEYLQAGFETRRLSSTYQVLAQTIEQAQALAILIVGALLVMRETGFTIGMLVAFQMFAGRLAQPVLNLVGLYLQFQQVAIAVRRLGDILDAPREPHALTPARGADKPGRIEISRLGFRHGPELPWLYRDLDLAIAPGSCIALMGASGCGKSTLARLLLGFVLPVEGAIRIDGVDTRHLAANELRAYFGVVPQETILFSGTVYDNLVAAHPQANFEDVVNACKLAEIHDFIEQLPNGYQTGIGERGAGLSGGQKQRIAIARALLKRPKVLIFDEATSNLDPATAEAFARTVNRLKGMATMIFIAHQLPKGLQVDAVVRLDRAGTPTQLEQRDMGENT